MRIFIFICLVATLSIAHPHVFVDVSYNVMIKKNATKIDVSWTFDEMNSQMLLFDFGIMRSQDITQKKIDSIKKEYFQPLKEFDFYTFVSLDEKPVSIPQPQNFLVSVDNNRLTYHFTLMPKIDATKGELKIGSFDAENLLALDIISDKTDVSTTVENLHLDKQITFEDKDDFVVDVLIIRAKR
ncbi:MAG: hypothetical protein QG564_763 [Campylobacterota bacterium]|nr:hypothetical protein [Campylobacterota bacterium]